MELQLSEKEIMMIVPNNVTFGQYHVSEWQENLLTLIGDKLQKHITRQQVIPRDLFNQPYVEILCDEAGGKNHKSMVKKEVLDLCRKTFTFSWVHPEVHRTIESTGVIITTYHDIKGTNKVILNLNLWAIPFLLYYGIGVGGTRYNKAIALSLRGNYTKRMYKIICSQQDRSEYYYTLDKFREDFKIPEKYTNAGIERMILKPAQERIRESGSHVWFEYELTTRHPIKGRKPKADTIILRIKSEHPKVAGGEQYQEYYFVYRWISSAMGNPTNDSALQAVDKIVASGRLKEIFERCCYYDDRVASGQQTSIHAKNAILKMLREDFNIDNKKNVTATKGTKTTKETKGTRTTAGAKSNPKKLDEVINSIRN